MRNYLITAALLLTVTPASAEPVTPINESVVRAMQERVIFFRGKTFYWPHSFAENTGINPATGMPAIPSPFLQRTMLATMARQMLPASVLEHCAQTLPEASRRPTTYESPAAVDAAIAAGKQITPEIREQYRHQATKPAEPPFGRRGYWNPQTKTYDTPNPPDSFSTDAQAPGPGGNLEERDACEIEELKKATKSRPARDITSKRGSKLIEVLKAD